MNDMAMNQLWATHQAKLEEKDAEIERLRGEIRKLETLWFSENYRMRDLLKRAADALENLEVGSFVYGRPLGLIADLRKAAQ